MLPLHIVRLLSPSRLSTRSLPQARPTVHCVASRDLAIPPASTDFRDRGRPGFAQARHPFARFARSDYAHYRSSTHCRRPPKRSAPGFPRSAPRGSLELSVRFRSPPLPAAVGSSAASRHDVFTSCPSTSAVGQLAARLRISWLPLGTPQSTANGRSDPAPLFPGPVRLIFPKEHLPKDLLPPVVITDMNLPHAA